MNLIRTLRRPDWIDELHGVLLLGTVLTGAGGIAAVVATLAGQPIQVEVATGTALRPDALTGAPPGVVLGDSLLLDVTDPTAAQLGWALLAALPRFVLVTVTLALLWRAIGRARRTDPFRSGLAGSLRSLGILLIGGGVLAWLTEVVARFGLSSTVDVGGTYTTVDLTVPAVWLFFGITLLAVGEIVRRGQEMRADLDGVV
ncbi:hypothetical protein AB0G04_41760 [Actinoplanes sp. NPDC023801]|uniref:hypothetical protein n=1 Tax=Actinoplanes sp. NPDC023801 TaxID=3154595 RepID=UPI003410ADB4